MGNESLAKKINYETEPVGIHAVPNPDADHQNVHEQEVSNEAIHDNVVDFTARIPEEKSDGLQPTAPTHEPKEKRVIENNLGAGEGDIEILQLFMNDIKQHELLTAEEEVELSVRIWKGDQEAKEKMINSNLRLVVSIARQYIGQDMSLLDLIQEGTLGLVRATEKFDHRKGFKFSTYASIWIRQAVERSLANKSRTIRMPVHVVEKVRKIQRTTRELTAQLEREPTIAEIAAAIDYETREVERILLANQPVTSLDKPVGEDEGLTLGDLVTDGSDATFNEANNNIEGDEMGDALEKAMKILTPRERHVLRSKFGLGGKNPRSASKLANDWGVTTSYIYMLEKKALKKLEMQNDPVLREVALAIS